MYREAEALVSKTIESLPADQPLLGAALRCRRARLWDELGTRADLAAILDQQIALADGDDAVTSRCLLDRATVAMSNGDAHGALAFAREARLRYDRAGADSIFDRANLLISLGGAYGVIGRFAEAHSQYTETLAMFEAAGRGRSRAAASLRDDWATIWMNSGNPRRALEEIDRAWEIMQELSPAAQNSDERIARRGRILSQLGEYDESLAHSREAARLAAPRGNLPNLAAIRIGEADALVQSGRLREAEAALDGASITVREASMSPTNLINVRYRMTRAQWLAARGDSRAAREMFTDVLARYESQNCCSATRSFVHAERAALEVGSDLAAAEADAAKARELAPSVADESFSRFTGQAWFVTGLVAEKRRKLREARDAFATAAVQFAGSLGEEHPQTLRARDAISRVSDAAPTENYN